MRTDAPRFQSVRVVKRLDGNDASEVKYLFHFTVKHGVSSFLSRKVPSMRLQSSARSSTWSRREDADEKEDGHPRRGSRGYRALLPPHLVRGDLGSVEEQELRGRRRPERDHHGRGTGHRAVRRRIHDDRWVWWPVRAFWHMWVPTASFTRGLHCGHNCHLQPQLSSLHSSHFWELKDAIADY